MKIAVTGGSGFIGSNFILYWFLHYPQDEIINIDKLTYAGNPQNLKSVETLGNYTFIQADICDKDAMRKALVGVDILVHFAAESHVDRSITNASDFIQTNIVGTHTLLEIALALGIQRFHHISTDEVYGALELESKQKFHEESVYKPNSPYSASKAGSDHLVRAYYQTYGLPITISNCSNNFGPYQFPEKLIPLAITNLLENKRVPVYGDGLYTRDWLYVEDHVRAIDLIVKKGKIGETYCIGGLNDEISNLEIVKKIIRIMNKSESAIEFVKDRPGHDRKYAIDWSKIREEFHWSPKHNFDEYLVKTVEWYTHNRSWWEEIKNGQYVAYYKKQYGGSQ